MFKPQGVKIVLELLIVDLASCGLYGNPRLLLQSLEEFNRYTCVPRVTRRQIKLVSVTAVL